MTTLARKLQSRGDEVRFIGMLIRTASQIELLRGAALCITHAGLKRLSNYWPRTADGSYPDLDTTSLESPPELRFTVWVNSWK
jgi:hypothetical protein